MSNDFSNMRTPGRADQIRRKTPDGVGLYVVFGVAVLFAAIIGGLVVFFALRASDNSVAANRAAPAQNAPAAGQGAGQGAPAPVTWQTTGTFGSWQVQCQAQNAKVCRAMLSVVDNRSKQTLMAPTAREPSRACCKLRRG